MKPALPTHLLSCLIIFSLLFSLPAGHAHGQLGQETLPMAPLSPIAPKDYQECNALQQQWSQLYSQIDRMHESCLESHRKNGEKSNPESGYGSGSRCSYGGCQALHTRKYEINEQQIQSVDACRAAVRQYKDEMQRQKEDAERLRREQEEREEKERRAREEREEKERKAREQQQERQRKVGEEKERRANEQADKEDAAREHRETNKKLIDMAAEQSRRAQEGLAQRSGERRQQMEELKGKEQVVNERFDNSVEQQTAAAQKELFDQVARNAGTENKIFPTPAQADGTGVGGEEYDLTGIAGGTVKPSDGAGGAAFRVLSEIPSVAPESESGAVPERNSVLYEAYRKTKDFVSPLTQSASNYLREKVGEAVDENKNGISHTFLTGALGSEDAGKAALRIARTQFNNEYKDPLRGVVEKAYGSVGNKPVEETLEFAAKFVNDELQFGGTGHLAGDGFGGALRDVGLKVGVEKLSEYAKKTIIDKTTEKFTEVYRSISERIAGPSDHITQPVTDTALVGLPKLISKMGSPAAALEAIHKYQTDMVNSMGEMFDRLIKSDFYGTAPPDTDPPNR
jgi:hypothetical protein